MRFVRALFKYRIVIFVAILILPAIFIDFGIPVLTNSIIIDREWQTRNTQLTFNEATGYWYSWTRNPDFNSYGSYWKARTWKWDILGRNEAGGPNDKAYFYYGFADYLLYSKAVGVLDGYTHCAGATQGWVWSSSPPSGIYQPTPLRITSSIQQLKAKTNLISYTYSSGGLWGVLSNIWFKVEDVYDAKNHVFRDYVLGIDFYYAEGGQAISDGTFRVQRTTLTMVYTKMPNTGTGWTTVDVLQALEEAQQKARSCLLYFDISDCILYQAEVLVEGAYTWQSGWASADYSYFKVYYYDPPGKTIGFWLYYTSERNNMHSMFVDLRKTSDITYGIQKISNDIELNNGFYNITLKVAGDAKESIIDFIKLLAVDKNSNNVTEVPVHFAFSQLTAKYINDLIVKEDGASFKLLNGDSLELWFDSSDIPYTEYSIYILIGARTI